MQQFTVSNRGKKKTSDQQHQQLNILKMICSIYESKCICKQWKPDPLSDLSNKPENKSNYTLCVIMLSVYINPPSPSGTLYSTASIYMWHCDAMTM